MAYSKKTWLQRIVENPGRRLLTATGTTNVWDITRNEGVVVQAGDAFSVANMNDMETRIETAFNAIDDWVDITSQCTWSSLLNTTALGGIAHHVKVNTATRTVNVCGFFNSGRVNSANLVSIPTQYAPTASNTPLGVTRYDVVKSMSVNYFIKSDGGIFGSHSVATTTGMEENINFTFTY